MRCYFNLVDSRGCILDREGVEVADMEALREEVATAINEMKHADPAAARDWRGWQMEVTDSAGAVLLTINLDLH
jgi:hypothetical protein